MNKEQILKLSEKKINKKNVDSIKNILQNNYDISYGTYENYELRKAIKDLKPFYIQDHFIVGYDGSSFISDENDRIPIERMVKAIIVEDEKISEPEEKIDNRDHFAIIGKMEWGDITDFLSLFSEIRVGEVIFPKHSVIFNFINEKPDSKTVSMTKGVNIYLYDKDNYIDNAIHEIGHIFWKDCLKYEEKKDWETFFKYLKPSALFVYDWEKKNAEEVFCTIYKWFVKSVMIHKSFYNILKHEDDVALNFIQNIMERIAKDKMTEDVWRLKKDDLMNYLNPKIDIKTGKRFIKQGLFDEIKDVELPDSVLRNVSKFQNGTMFIDLNKAIVPVKGNKIDWVELNEKKIKNQKN